MNLRAILFKIYPLFYSYKPPLSYQVKDSNRFIPPSVLLSATYRYYIELTGKDYSPESLMRFLNSIKYAGLTSSSEEIHITSSSFLLRLWRIAEAKGKKKKEEEKTNYDAMRRIYISTSKPFLGFIIYEPSSLSGDILIRAVESIIWLGDNVCDTKVEVVETDLPIKVEAPPDEAFMTQIVSSEREKLPQRFVGR